MLSEIKVGSKWKINNLIITVDAKTINGVLYSYSNGVIAGCSKIIFLKLAKEVKQ